MLRIEQNESPGDSDEPSRSQALVPGAGSYDRRASVIRAARPDAGFVAHLIATAEHLPQTRTLRRAAPADAQSAYAARQRPAATAGGTTREVI